MQNTAGISKFCIEADVAVNVATQEYLRRMVDVVFTWLLRWPGAKVLECNVCYDNVIIIFLCCFQEAEAISCLSARRISIVTPESWLDYHVHTLHASQKTSRHG